MINPYELVCSSTPTTTDPAEWAKEVGTPEARVCAELYTDSTRLALIQKMAHPKLWCDRGLLLPTSSIRDAIGPVMFRYWRSTKIGREWKDTNPENRLYCLHVWDNAGMFPEPDEARNLPGGWFRSLYCQPQAALLDAWKTKYNPSPLSDTGFGLGGLEITGRDDGTRLLTANFNPMIAGSAWIAFDDE